MAIRPAKLASRDLCSKHAGTPTSFTCEPNPGSCRVLPLHRQPGTCSSGGWDNWLINILPEADRCLCPSVSWPDTRTSSATDLLGVTVGLFQEHIWPHGKRLNMDFPSIWLRWSSLTLTPSSLCAASNFNHIGAADMWTFRRCSAVIWACKTLFYTINVVHTSVPEGTQGRDGEPHIADEWTKRVLHSICTTHLHVGSLPVQSLLPLSWTYMLEAYLFRVYYHYHDFVCFSFWLDSSCQDRLLATNCRGP